MIKLYTFLLFSVFFHSAQAQLNVSVYWGGEPIKLEKYYRLGKDSLIFHEIKFYLSDFEFKKETRSHVIVGPRLIDLDDSATFQLFPNFPVDEYQFISFHFGLDSAYQVSEIVDGPLNPMNGMYWAWNSGYIQFKCTGRASAIPLTDQIFEYHLGGYRQPFETVLPIELPIIGNKLILNVKPFFEHSVNFQKVQRVMIPGRIAQWYCQELSEHFRTE
jgi:hypothetical protein